MRVLFVDKVHPVLSERLEQQGFECIHFEDHSIEEIHSILPEIDGLVIRSRFPINKDFLSQAKALKFIARSGAGMENIDISFCEQNNISLFNAPEGNRDAVGEHAIAMILSLFNKLQQGQLQIEQGIWDREGNRGFELGGKTVGIIGYGNNGKAFAKKLSGFGVKVLAFDKYLVNYSDEFAEESSMDDLFEYADIISFHIPQNEETLFLADEDFFSRCKKDIYVINLARGKIIRTNALVDALKKGKVKGACLDVLEYEKTSFENMFGNKLPSDFKYLIEAKNVLLSPHVGGWTVESYFKLSNVLANKILTEFKSINHSE